jgi:hypothetical protein
MRGVGLLDLMESRRSQMEIRVRTPVEDVSVNAWDELQVDTFDLDTELAAIPGQIAYWIALTARFRLTVEATRRGFDDWYGPLYEKEFVAYEKDSGRRPNMNSVDYLVRMKYREEYNTRKGLLDQAEADLQVVEGMIRALEAKVQSLIQLAKRQQVELDHTTVGLRGGTASPTPHGAPPVRSPKTGDEVTVAEADSILRSLTSKGGRK